MDGVNNPKIMMTFSTTDVFWFGDDGDGNGTSEDSLVTLGTVSLEKDGSSSQPSQKMDRSTTIEKEKLYKDAEFVETWCSSPGLKRSIVAYCRAQSFFASSILTDDRSDSMDELMVSVESLSKRTIKTEAGSRLATLTLPRIVLKGEAFEEVAERAEAYFLIQKLNGIL